MFECTDGLSASWQLDLFDDAVADVVMTERVGTHGGDFQRFELHLKTA